MTNGIGNLGPKAAHCHGFGRMVLYGVWCIGSSAIGQNNTVAGLVGISKLFVEQSAQQRC